MRAFWVDIGYACFGIASDSKGVVREAAPIAAWMIGKTLDEIKPFLLKKRAKVLELRRADFPLFPL